MRTVQLFLKKLSKTLNWYHLIFIVFVFILIIFFLISKYPNYLILKILYSTGRIFFISLISLFFALLIGIFLSNIYLFTSLKIVKTMLDIIFIIPFFLYGVLYLTIFSPVGIKDFIILFSLLISYSFFNKITEKVEELNKEKFITHLRSIDISYFRIFLKHILPMVSLPLIVSFIEYISFIISFEFIISITNIIKPFNSDINLGTIGYSAITSNNYPLILIILLFFTLLTLEINYVVYNIREILNKL